MTRGPMSRHQRMLNSPVSASVSARRSSSPYICALPHAAAVTKPSSAQRSRSSSVKASRPSRQTSSTPRRWSPGDQRDREQRLGLARRAGDGRRGRVRVGVGAAVRLAAPERPSGDAVVQRHLHVEEPLGARHRRARAAGSGDAPSPPRRSRAGRRSSSGRCARRRSRGSARDRAPPAGCARRPRGTGRSSDRRARRPRRAGAASSRSVRSACRHARGRRGPRGAGTRRPAPPRPWARRAPHRRPADARGAARPRTGRRARPPPSRVALLSMPRATIRPPSRATYTTAAARWALATSFSCEPGRHRLGRGRRSRVGDQRSAVDRAIGESTPSTASRNPRSRSVAETAKARHRRGRPRSRSGRSRRARRDSRRGAAPATRDRNPPPRARRDEAGRAAPPDRCAGRASAPPRSACAARRPAGRGSASYPRSTRSMRSITGCSATPGPAAFAARLGGCTAHDCGFQAVPHIGSLIGTIPP